MLDGRILAREGAQFREDNNVLSRMKAALLTKVSNDLYLDPSAGDFRAVNPRRLSGPGTALDDPGRDLCGQAVNAERPPLGPIRYRRDMTCTPIFR